MAHLRGSLENPMSECPAGLGRMWLGHKARRTMEMQDFTHLSWQRSTMSLEKYIVEVKIKQPVHVRLEEFRKCKNLDEPRKCKNINPANAASRVGEPVIPRFKFS